MTPSFNLLQLMGQRPTWKWNCLAIWISMFPQWLPFSFHSIQHMQWFIYNFGLMGPGTRCFQYQWVPTANLWVLNTIFNDKSAILLHPGTRWNKNLCAKDAGCAGNKITAYGLGDVIWRIGNISILDIGTNNFITSKCSCCPKPPANFLLNQTYGSKGDVLWRKAAILEITTKEFWLLWISMLPQCLQPSFSSIWHMSHDMWFPTMWHFDMNRHRQACVASF